MISKECGRGLMKRLNYFKLLILVCFLFTSGIALALPVAGSNATVQKPILIIIVDKLDGIELFHSDLPSIKKLITTSACGLMNIRSSSGYTDSGSGYLSLGAGSRATATGQPGGAFGTGQSLNNGKAGSYINWSLGIPLTSRSDKSMVVPEIGWILNQAHLEDHPVIPGRLGSVFQRQGWRTCLIGNIDSPEQKNRPGGLLLMNQNGLIDEGNISTSLNEKDPNFPYLYRDNVSTIITELHDRLAERKVIAIDFGDFARLDLYREQMSPTLYYQAKQHTWERFNFLMQKILQLGTPEKFTMVLISPSISKEGIAYKNLLAPIVIYSREYPPGLLVSGTTRWPGLVANIDLLPTLASIARLNNSNSFAGKTIKCIPMSDSIAKLRHLNEQLIMINANQRPMLDWYLGIISFCWIVGWFSIVYLKKRRIGDWLISGVTAIPFTLIILPLFPANSWQVAGLLGVTLILTAILTLLKAVDTRILILSGLIWMALMIDQLFGWHLIRFSALGYNAMAGSRYYGLGNEYLGILLAVALLFTHLLTRKTTYKWPATIILGLTIFILSWPQFGAKFGGILAGTAGFAYYLAKLYHLKLTSSKLWLSLLGCCLVLLSIGWWDSMRPSDSQTHIGRFLHLFFSKDFGQIGQIIVRKTIMNLKLTIFSPWIRIILLALALGILNRWLTAKNMIQPEDTLVWQSILVAGLAAYLLNDAGVLAFATCLAYAFSFILLKNKSSRRSKKQLTIEN
jgi:hypothetical protein